MWVAPWFFVFAFVTLSKNMNGNTVTATTTTMNIPAAVPLCIRMWYNDDNAVLAGEANQVDASRAVTSSTWDLCDAIWLGPTCFAARVARGWTFCEWPNQWRVERQGSIRVIGGALHSEMRAHSRVEMIWCYKLSTHTTQRVHTFAWYASG